MMDTGTDLVLAEVDDGVGVVTLNRPARHNALHEEMYEAVPLVVERFIEDPAVGCIVITGAGRAFCAGGDVRDGAARNRAAAQGAAPATIEQRAATLLRNARMVEVIYGSPKITIAALPGAAVGAGLSIALAADLRVAARSARLIAGWGPLGFSGDFGGTWFLTRLVGPSKALELFVDDIALSAETALALGLVNRVVPDGQLAVAARAWARTIAAGPRAAWALFKANVRDAERSSLAEALPVESERMARSGQTEDHHRAVRRWLAEAAAKRAGRAPH